jgi:hypothetical protein
MGYEGICQTVGEPFKGAILRYIQFFQYTSSGAIYNLIDPSHKSVIFFRHDIP